MTRRAPFRIFGREPVLVAGTVQAAIGLAVAFDLVDAVQGGAITAFAAAALALVTRRKVTPVP